VLLIAELDIHTALLRNETFNSSSVASILDWHEWLRCHTGTLGICIANIYDRIRKISD